MGTGTRSRNGGRRREQEEGKKPPRRQPPKQQEYEETPDYGTAFHRPDNEGSQPKFTGTGVLSEETLDAIRAAGGEFQIAVWTGRTKGGTRRLRVHLEPPWEGGDDDDGDEWDDDDDGDDETPF